MTELGFIYIISHNIRGLNNINKLEEENDSINTKSFKKFADLVQFKFFINTLKKKKFYWY